ncbi:unnamed protein product [Clavelina lepadiformis]|uniref:Uncharacterized protein n=1 Tax=Clavelina lepadiformis TaxID=159417 RepID=A0ABP0G056_CLALP
MAVKRKSNTGAADKQTDEPNAPKHMELDTGVVATKKNKTEVDKNAVTSNQVIVYPPAQKCIGILPGISGYEDSGDSDSSLVDLCDSSSSS